MDNTVMAYVSRETQDRLEAYVDLIRKWNSRINLVSRSSLDDLWDRHIIDSAQIFELSHRADRWADLGSGGGLPGLVLAIMALEQDPARETILVDSDQRKCAFLRTVARELKLNATVLSERVETMDPLEANVLSARALAPLTQLMAFAERHLEPGGHAFFPKGRNWGAEVDDARREWRFDLQAHPSATDSGAAILEIRDLQRV
ncbi:16S rRNA (guanine(527)-N(7))-methyltransferase RsmG [Sulfitobacter sp. LCG007]